VSKVEEQHDRGAELLFGNLTRGMSMVGDPRRVALFVHGLAVLIGTGVTVQGHWPIAD